MGSISKDNEPIVLNGAFHMSTTVMQFVVASAVEVELGALFLEHYSTIVKTQ